MTSREIVKAVIEFDAKERIAVDFNENFGNDFYYVGPQPSPDERRNIIDADEWGSVWENIGVSRLGEVKYFPLIDWKDKDKLPIPDVKRPDRWKAVERARAEHKDRFIMGAGISIYERIHFIRGLENTWVDIHENPDELCWLLDILTDMNLYCIEKFKEAGFDGFTTCDDWGLQERLMINPADFRKLWKPHYARIYSAAHRAGLKTILHSCGHITEILDDLIDAGLDVIQMDQQMNMGLDNLSKQFAGRITFYSPADIQMVLPYASEDEVRDYCRQLFSAFWRNGGFIPKIYGDNVGAGFTIENENVMCLEFLKIGKEIMDSSKY